jgi:hypothetical protein
MTGAAKIGTDEIQDGSAGGCGGSRIDGGWRGEGLVEFAVAVKVASAVARRPAREKFSVREEASKNKVGLGEAGG